MKTVVVDLGNETVKYKGECLGCFSSKKHSNFESNYEAFQRITFEGVTTYLGVGSIEREYSKVDKNYLAQLLYAISKATTEENINLCLLLPIDQMASKEILVNKLRKKTFKYNVNNDGQRVVKINEVVILPEGQVARYSSNDIQRDYSLIIDIGSRTVNWSSYLDGSLEKNGTEKIGLMDLFNQIKKIENSKGEDYQEEDIYSQIKRGRINVESNLHISFLKDILNRIKLSVNIKNYDVYFCGGGAVFFEKIIYQIPNANIISNPIYANVIGAYNIVNESEKISLWK